MWNQVVALLALVLFPLAATAEELPPTNEPSPTTEWNQLCSDHKVLAWYMDALDHPEALESIDNATLLPMLQLMELRGNDDVFNRKASPVRKNIEAEILADIEQNMAQEPKEAPVRLLSLFCTGYLEDWKIVDALFAEGGHWY